MTPSWCSTKNRRDHKAELGLTMLWTAITGFPVKLSKTDSGDSVKWIGANLTVDDNIKAMVVRIPADKVTELKEKLEDTLKKTVIGRKQLQSLAGALSFVAGVVPIMRPFLSSLWAAMKTNDGPQRTRNVIHVRRIAAALMWINEMLGEKNFPFVRTVRSVRVKTNAILITDASTMGLGGVLMVGGSPIEFFSTPIPHEFLSHTGAKPGDPKHMALWEALCLLLAARTWLTRFPLGSVVRVKADNIGALHLLAKGKARSPDLSIVAREISLDVATEKYEFTLLQHLNTKLNKIADALSRQHDPSPPPFPSKALAGAKRIPIEVSHNFWVFPKFSRRLIGLKTVLGVLGVVEFLVSLIELLPWCTGSSMHFTLGSNEEVTCPKDMAPQQLGLQQWRTKSQIEGIRPSSRRSGVWSHRHPRGSSGTTGGRNQTLSKGIPRLGYATNSIEQRGVHRSH